MQQSPNRDNQQTDRSGPGEFHNATSAMGAVTHIVKMAGILSPLLIMELVKEPEKRYRWIRIAAVATAGLTEVLWSTRVKASREQEHHR